MVPLIRKSGTSTPWMLVVFIVVVAGIVTIFTLIQQSEDEARGDSGARQVPGAVTEAVGLNGSDNSEVFVPEAPSKESKVGDLVEDVDRYVLRASNIEGTIEELLEREAAGDVGAGYELAARTTDCLLGHTEKDCDYYKTTVDRVAERIEHAAANGVVAAQIDYWDIERVDPSDASKEKSDYRVQQYVNNLHSAKSAGSADAIYLLALMEITALDGGPRMDVGESRTGLSRLDAVAHLVASAAVYSKATDNQSFEASANVQLARLSPREVDEVNEIANRILSSPSCCFVLKRGRTINNDQIDH